MIAGSALFYGVPVLSRDSGIHVATSKLCGKLIIRRIESDMFASIEIRLTDSGWDRPDSQWISKSGVRSNRGSAIVQDCTSAPH